MGVSCMNIRKLFYLRKINIAKLVMVSCIFLFAFLFINTKVEAAASITINSSTYSGNSNAINANAAKEINGTMYIQGTGISNKDGITFTLTNMYTDITDYTAFAVWESAFSSSSDNEDYDRWYIRTHECKDVDCSTFESLNDNDYVMKDSSDNIIFKAVGLVRYYIEREHDSVVTGEGYQETIVDFSEFFTNKKITYTYRIRNANYLNRADKDGFGYKQIQINYWKAASKDDDLDKIKPIAGQTIEFGLAKAISDVESYTNHNHPEHVTGNGISCSASANLDYICVDYVDTNGDESKATTIPATPNIYLPNNILYSHASTTRNEVQANLKADGTVDLNGYVKENNTLYALNYFCEGDRINPANIVYDSENNHSANCGTSNSLGTLRQYLYVEASLVGEDIDDVEIDEFNKVNQLTSFLANSYHLKITVDSRGNYVLIIRDIFGNTNEVAIMKVMDIINQALIAYFEKDNKTNETVVESDGWKANEYLTNNDVTVTITMSATTVIEQGLPIIAAETTLLDKNYVKYVYYWRVDGSEYTSDVCAEGVKDDCAIMPDADEYTKLYESTGGAATPTTHESFVSFEGNALSMKISSNGRYRFYIETFPGNNTNTNEGEKKNPRVEVYKIDKEAPEILFGGSTNSYCPASGCKYVEETYAYYQGTGNESGSIIEHLVNEGDADYTITFNPSDIYYLSASEDGNSILGSAIADDKEPDIWYTYLYALFNSKVYVKENLSYYDEDNTMYAYYQAKSSTESEYKLYDSSLVSLDESAYREYIISNNIKYTAYSLARNSITFKDGEPTHDQDRLKIEYLDATDSDTTVCDKISSVFDDIDLNDDDAFDQNDCVNYYLDHGIDFIIRITAYDVVQDSEGKYILGNETTKEIKVDVMDTTAPGFNKEIEKYNEGSECRIEIGNTLGITNQKMEQLLECYGITTSTIHHFEDNVFEDLYSQLQTVSNKNHISMYILSLETGEWVSLKEGDGYTPNRSGNYAILVVINDDASTTTTFDFTGKEYHGVSVDSDSTITVTGNAIATVLSYYVDKKIVVVTPNENEKFYGEDDPVFTYCVSINKNNSGIAEYLQAPFTDMSVFTEVGCATVSGTSAGLTDEELEEIFKGNLYDEDTEYGAKFDGNLTRQESYDYNIQGSYGRVSNDYIGLYKVVLGSLNIVGSASDGYDIGEDYIVKIDPRVRNGQEYQLNTIEGVHRLSGSQKSSLVDSQVYNNEVVSGKYGFTDDDDFFVESTVLFTIKQVVLTVTATGASKIYGEVDPNYNQANNDYVGDENAYLNGYSVEGLEYTDTASVVKGVLRREIGENVGVYAICNYRGLSIADTTLELKNNMLVINPNELSEDYRSCSNFDAYANTVVNTGTYKSNGLIDLGENGDNFIASRALYIAPNIVSGFRKTLNALPSGDLGKRNSAYANYVISYQEAVFEIDPTTMVVQPAPGQRREYSYNGVDEVNPWEVVVYGAKSFAVAASGENFNGYTQDSPTYTTTSANDVQSKDYGSPDSGTENYNNASEDRDEWILIRDGVTYNNGFKTNETYKLFEGRISLKGRTPEDGVYKNMSAGWYNYNELVDSTLQIIVNGRKQCSYSDYVSNAAKDKTGDCRNYDLVLDLDYRNEDGYKNGATDSEGNTAEVVYMSKLGYCKTTTLGNVSDVEIQCSNAQSSKILFEVYRREIILEFNSLLEKIPSNEVDMVYGLRYDYYFTNLFEISSNSANKNHLENSLFYCYASYKDGLTGLSGDCSNNKWYGLTEGDSWVNVGLEFHLHSIVSDEDSDYYDTDSDKAIPAGRYFVYSTINAAAKENYKYNYLGGTLTIKTKAVGIELTNYNKEYGNVYYDNVTCMKDGSILNASDDLINDCSDESNTTDNTYGFIVKDEDLDSKDLIKDNFTGRPKRDSNLAHSLFVYTDTNGLQENVGIYDIKVGSIHSKNNNSFTACSGNFTADETNCVVVDGVSINNYTMSNDTYTALTYYLLKNGNNANNKDYSSSANTTVVNSGNMTLEEATLTINPARIDITVSANQTKMYGCSYNEINTTSSYKYGYDTGYDCVSGTGTNYDLGYEYTVEGDKDYYIYNYGYYDTNYNFNTTYTSSKINMVSESSVDPLLLVADSKNIGLRSSALNGGVLYRVNFNNFTNALTYSDLVLAADNAQALTHYQGQSVGRYAITLGNLNATLTSEFEDQYLEDNNKVCGSDNLPINGGSEICRNYIIYYYENTSVTETHTYSKLNSSETTFTITPRVAFIYTDYNSKVYGNAEPDLSKICNEEMEEAGFCRGEEEIDYGISYYYTKYNSLAKAPWVASIENDASGKNIYFATSNVNDVQTDVVVGKVTRVGMNNEEMDVDDIVGDYNFLFTGVSTTDYSANNYNLNFYYRELDSEDKIVIKDGEVDDSVNPYIEDDFGDYQEKQAVNSDGGIDTVVDGKDKEIYFEITLRKITVTLISFSKVYGIEDHVKYYDLGICATGDEVLEFDEKGNPKCAYAEGRNSTEHGLSQTHKNLYVQDGLLNQSTFKTAFGVSFLRALGENTACSSSAVTGTISGFFPDDATSYEYNLACSASGNYEALGIIKQTSSDDLGFNYEITYVEGIMSILSRNINVTPDSGQGFQYGSYTYPTLIPAITFATSIASADYHKSNQKVVAYDLDGDDAKVVIVNRDSTKVSDLEIDTIDSGLVNGGEGARVCLKNIDKTNTFCINDRQDVYNVDIDEKTISEYRANTDGSVTDDAPTYIFGDVYQSEDSTRHALNRSLSGKNDERYNRNVGTYTITIGDLVDENGSDLSGNYKIIFASNISYVVTPSNVKITPDSNQNKTYGEADKELTFSVETTYTVNSTQYVMYDESIVSIKDKDGNALEIAKDAQNRVKVIKGSTITLAGYAYYENSTNADYNYGKIMNSNKSAASEAVAQSNVEGKSYDKYCYDNYSDNSTVDTGVIASCNEQKVSVESTTLVLVGYLYIDSYKQKAGEHLIVNGFALAKNEFGVTNYSLEFVDTITFTINKLAIEVKINSVSKTYGQSTDAYKCEEGVDCTSGYATLSSQDNEGRLEYNFDILYKDEEEIISENTYGGETMVLMVNSINGKYYTQSEGREDKNNFLGVTVIRGINDTTCTVDTDVFGCEDVGTYKLRLRKFDVTLTEKDGSSRYDDNYSLVYSNDNEVSVSNVDNTYIVVDLASNEVEELAKIDIINSLESSLTITKRSVDIFVNTNLNSSATNYYEIEQNIEVPNLPIINNNYNLIDYVYDASKTYHGLGEDASSTSSNADLASTYTKIVWGDKPNQVRIGDSLVGELAYCNEPYNGNLYQDTYPLANTLCEDNANLIYNSNKRMVNTNTKDKFIIMTRDVSSDKGLKIRPNSSNVMNNAYESKNYEVLFYPGAVHVIGDSKDPTLVVGNKDYYIEANAVNNEGTITGSVSSLGTILEFLFNGDGSKAHILASVDDNGNLYVTISNTKITITQAALQAKYGSGSDTYPGIISGVEQSGVYPFISDFAHTSDGSASYLNEENIKSLAELVTTFIKWFDVTSYDSGQLINGQYLERKFDKYYYMVINSNGTNIAGDIDNNQFAINKVGTYSISFYVMDNAGRISKDGNTAKLHIIDTTKPNGGELTLYNAPVACDSECNNKDQWYINANSIPLAAFNRYRYDDVNGEYILDSEGEYIYFDGTGGPVSPYKKLSDLKNLNLITKVNNMEYIDTSGKKSALGIIHYGWATSKDGIHLTITGASDNSYTFEGNSSKSQWKYYYSIDGGIYWLEYDLAAGMSSYSALTSDGIRTIQSLIIDSGIKTSETNTTYSITYDLCFEGCDPIEIPNKVEIDGTTYSFSESDIKNSYFDFDGNTRCVINKQGTLITCEESAEGRPTVTKRVKLEGDRFTFEGNDYLLAGSNVLATGGYQAKLYRSYVTIDGVDYRYDSSAMMLYRDHIGYLGIAGESGQKLFIDGTEYLILGTELLLGGIKVADIDNYSFNLHGLNYIYVDGYVKSDDPDIYVNGHYIASEGFEIYQDAFIIDGHSYSLAVFNDNKYEVNKDKLVLSMNKNYTDTFRLYDSFLLGVTNDYADAVEASEESLAFRMNVTPNVGWLTSDIDSDGSVNVELSKYLGIDETTKYKRDSKTAYLDTTAPEVGLTMSIVVGEDTITEEYGGDWYVYEFGYNNVMTLDENYSYYLRGTTYTVNKDDPDNMYVSDGTNTYKISATNLADVNKKYMYEVNYNVYYLDENFTTVRWLNQYIEKYVGSKDMPSTRGVNSSESKFYDLNKSVFLGDVDQDTPDEIELITTRTTTSTSSGIGGNQYVTGGLSSTLFDFVYLGKHQNGIYYKDVDYIVWYTIVHDDGRVEVVEHDLSEEFKACYLVDGKITKDCAQRAIREVVVPDETSKKDITYTINYVVRDKAGNASAFASRGILYATILPATNVIVNNIQATPANSPIVVEEIAENTYEINANQGVSLDLLNEAFGVDYSSYFSSYNKAAVMTIYKGDKLIANNVRGVAFTDYIDSSEIAEYKIIYNMDSEYVTQYGERIPVTGKTITLHLNIGVPVIDEEISNIDISQVMTNESSGVLYALIFGFLALIMMGMAVIIIRKKKQ